MLPLRYDGSIEVNLQDSTVSRITGEPQKGHSFSAVDPKVPPQRGHTSNFAATSFSVSLSVYFTAYLSSTGFESSRYPTDA